MSLITTKRTAQQIDQELDKIQPVAERTNDAHNRANVAIEDATTAKTRATKALDHATAATAIANDAMRGMNQAVAISEDAKEIAKRSTNKIDSTHDLASTALTQATDAKSLAIGSGARSSEAFMRAEEVFAIASPLVDRIDAIGDEVKQLQRAIAGISLVIFGDAEPMDAWIGSPPGKGWTDYVNAELRSLDNTLDDHATKISTLEKLRAGAGALLDGASTLIGDIRDQRMASEGYVDTAIQRLSNALRDEWSRIHIKPGIVEAARRRVITLLGGQS